MDIAASARPDCIGSDDVPRQTSRSVRTDSGTPPDPRDVADVFRRRTRTPESPPSADWNEWQGPPGLFTSVPRITDEETHRRLMSEVEAGTANSAARYYAEMVRRHEEHARRTRGICPSPPRCPGSPLCDTLTIQPTFPQLTMGVSSTPADE